MCPAFLLLVGAVLAACAAAPAAPTRVPLPTRAAGSVLLLPPARATPTPAVLAVPDPRAIPAAPPAAALPGPTRAPAQRAFAAAFDAAAAERGQAAVRLAEIFRAPPPAGLATAHDEALDRYRAQVREIQATPPALAGLRALQERAELDIAAQREARRLIVHYWQTQREEDLAMARLARERADAANAEAMRIAQALAAVLP
ncbi:MAG: hypothetical protein HYU88_12875 [Chloroflexi bacterium]|nr:hypothetical protein [Chloroflexota bacterium]MBI4506250.1 hypothetical protein [Chloroflexota bacterium]